MTATTLHVASFMKICNCFSEVFNRYTGRVAEVIRQYDDTSVRRYESISKVLLMQRSVLITDVRSRHRFLCEGFRVLLEIYSRMRVSSHSVSLCEVKSRTWREQCTSSTMLSLKAGESSRLENNHRYSGNLKRHLVECGVVGS
jgi:hypothetical protein